MIVVCYIISTIQFGLEMEYYCTIILICVESSSVLNKY